MVAKPPRMVADVLSLLSDDLYTYGIRDVVIDALNDGGEPRMNFANDYLRLSPQLKDQLFKAEGVRRRKRDILEFIRLLVVELEDALEILPEDEQEQGKGHQDDDDDEWYSKKPRKSLSAIPFGSGQRAVSSPTGSLLNTPPLKANHPAKYEQKKQGDTPGSNPSPASKDSGRGSGKTRTSISAVAPPLAPQLDPKAAHTTNFNIHPVSPPSALVDRPTVKEDHDHSLLGLTEIPPLPSLNPNGYNPSLHNDSEPSPSLNPNRNKPLPPNGSQSTTAPGPSRDSPPPPGLNPKGDKQLSPLNPSGINPAPPKDSNFLLSSLNPNKSKPSPTNASGGFPLNGTRSIPPPWNPEGVEPPSGLNSNESKPSRPSDPISPSLSLKPEGVKPPSSLNNDARKPSLPNDSNSSPPLKHNENTLPPPVTALEPPQKPKKTWSGLGDSSQGPDYPENLTPSSQKPEVQLRTAKEYYEYLKDFINKNLGPFEFDKATTKDLANRAMQVAKVIKDDYELTDEEVGKMARLSLFDIFILCDNSGSMKFGKRVETLNKTLQGVAHWATRIEKDGISLRFLNRVKDEDGRFDNLTDLNEIDNLICSIPTKGNTRLGSVLSSKVVRPLLQRADQRAQQARDGMERSRRVCIKPRIVFIITDGQPEGEPKNCLRSQILAAKTGRLGTTYGPAATIFIITRVGHENSAIEFIESLSEDDQVSGMILSAADRLEDVIEKLMGEEESEKNRNAYERYLIKMFLCAVDGQAY
ncbi:hypothetical protein BDW59DRAFT_161000 [Aspergillus cavernicola]|uniref:VWFA domain-containing protein n=1 Tax=Aspergillus cavernicola TaxID=176166 RepID=A0ABR4IHZ2_9EURO